MDPGDLEVGQVHVGRAKDPVTRPSLAMPVIRYFASSDAGYGTSAPLIACQRMLLRASIGARSSSPKSIAIDWAAPNALAALNWVGGMDSGKALYGASAPSPRTSA